MAWRWLARQWHSDGWHADDTSSGASTAPRRCRYTAGCSRALGQHGHGVRTNGELALRWAPHGGDDAPRATRHQGASGVVQRGLHMWRAECDGRDVRWWAERRRLCEGDLEVRSRGSGQMSVLPTAVSVPGRKSVSCTETETAISHSDISGGEVGVFRHLSSYLSVTIMMVHAEKNTHQPPHHRSAPESGVRRSRWRRGRLGNETAVSGKETDFLPTVHRDARTTRNVRLHLQGGALTSVSWHTGQNE